MGDDFKNQMCSRLDQMEKHNRAAVDEALKNGDVAGSMEILNKIKQIESLQVTAGCEASLPDGSQQGLPKAVPSSPDLPNH
jgi:hypothetical protein